MDRPARLIIVDDHDDVREALEARLNETDGLEVAGCTGCWRTALEEARRIEPDVVLLETKRVDGEGLEALQSLARQCPSASIIVLTTFLDAEERARAFNLGASRCLLKEIDTPQLVREIHAANPRKDRKNAEA